jgi:hypothetical protein
VGICISQGNFSERKIDKNVTFAKNFQGQRTVHNECLLDFVGAGSGFFLWCVYPTCLEFLNGKKFWRKIQRQSYLYTCSNVLQHNAQLRIA